MPASTIPAEPNFRIRFCRAARKLRSPIPGSPQQRVERNHDDLMPDLHAEAEGD